jgi:murein DD-endopeptidase MepM/ murein hydrolase activator NlpD
MVRKVSKSTTTLLGLILAGSGLLNSTASAASTNEFIFSNSHGFLPAENCKLVPKPDIDFRISLNTDDKDLKYENFRNRKLDPIGKVVNYSIVKLVDAAAVKDFRAVEITGVSENPDIRVGTRDVAQRNDQGYLYEKSLQPIKDYVIQLTNDIVLEDGSAVAQLPEINQNLKGAFLEAVMDAGETNYMAYHCDNTDYYAFDVHVADVALPIARVGVSFDDTKIFRNIRTYLPADAEKAIDQAGSFSAVTWNMLTNWVKGDPQAMEEGDFNEGDDENEEGMEVDEHAMDEEEISAAEVSEDQQSAAAGSSESSGDVPVIFGSLEYTVCTDSAVNVRDDSLDKVLFKASKYDDVKPAQSFDGDEKTKVIGGVETKFVLAQFPDESGAANTGWISADLIKPKSQCAGYQASLGDKQTIACTSSSDLNVRDENLSKVVFRANQFESLALPQNWEQSVQYKTQGGKRLEFVPVIFPGRENQTGYVARSFVQTKASCSAYKNRGSSAAEGAGSSQVSGGYFPTKGRPLQSYMEAPRRFRSSRAGGRRHAACDLYRYKNESIYAVSAGKVIRTTYYFYQGTYAIEVRNNDGKIVRYGEVTSKAGPRGNVNKGQVVAYVGKTSCCTPMLHFEMYSGSKSGSLTTKSGAFRRRSDLIDPTANLRSWEKARFGKSY